MQFTEEAPYMMTFRERMLFLENLKVKNHAGGTYMCADVFTKTHVEPLDVDLTPAKKD